MTTYGCVGKFLPTRYFETPAQQRRKAPVNVVLFASLVEVSAVVVTFSSFLWYFLTQKTSQVIISSRLLSADNHVKYQCVATTPLQGIKVFQLNSSENGQYAGSYFTYDECLSYLHTGRVCSSSTIYSYISIMGLDIATGDIRAVYAGEDKHAPLTHSLDLSLSAQIHTVNSGGHIVLRTNKWNAATTFGTKVAFGDSLSFPSINAPIIQFSLPPNHLGEVFMDVNSGLQALGSTIINSAGTPHLQGTQNSDTMYTAAPAIAIDSIDQSIWIQQAGSNRIQRKVPHYSTSFNTYSPYNQFGNFTNHTFSTHPYSHTGTDTFAVHNGICYMINIEGSGNADTNYYAQTIENPYYQYYSPRNPVLVQLSATSSGAIVHTKVPLTYQSISDPTELGTSHFSITFADDTGSVLVLQDSGSLTWLYVLKFTGLGSYSLLSQGQAGPGGLLRPSTSQNGLTTATVVYANKRLLIAANGKLISINPYKLLSTAVYAFTAVPVADKVGLSPFLYAMPSLTGTNVYINGNSRAFVLSSNLNLTRVDYWYSTNYMLAYSWAICKGVTETLFVNVSAFSHYGTMCQSDGNKLPDGFYYQSPNQWYNTPPLCAGMQPGVMLTKCPQVAANMAKLISTTCSESIEKVCRQMAEPRPPFQCSYELSALPLVALVNAAAGTVPAALLVAFIVGLCFSWYYPDYARTHGDEDDPVCSVEAVSNMLKKEGVISVGDFHTLLSLPKQSILALEENRGIFAEDYIEALLRLVRFTLKQAVEDQHRPGAPSLAEIAASRMRAELGVDWRTACVITSYLGPYFYSVETGGDFSGDVDIELVLKDGGTYKEVARDAIVLGASTPSAKLSPVGPAETPTAAVGENSSRSTRLTSPSTPTAASASSAVFMTGTNSSRSLDTVYNTSADSPSRPEKKQSPIRTPTTPTTPTVVAASTPIAVAAGARSPSQLGGGQY